MSVEGEKGEIRYAEDSRYFKTVVHPAKTQGEVIALLEEFDVTNIFVAQGQGVGGRHAWMVRFEWRGKAFRFIFTPLPCKDPAKFSSFGGTRRSHEKQSRYQMARTAVHFIKAVLTAADVQPAALFGFMELSAVKPHPGGLPRTAAEVGAEELSGRLLTPGFDDVIPPYRLLRDRSPEEESHEET